MECSDWKRRGAAASLWGAAAATVFLDVNLLVTDRGLLRALHDPYALEVILSLVILGLLHAQAALLAAWAGLGRAPLWVRNWLALGGLTVLFLTTLRYGTAIAPGARQVALGVAIAVTAVGVIVRAAAWLARRGGLRLIYSAAGESAAERAARQLPDADAGGRQFGLGHLLQGTALLACLLGAGRGLVAWAAADEFPMPAGQYWSALLTLTASSAAAAIVTVGVVWVGPVRWVGLRLLAAAIGCGSITAAHFLLDARVSGGSEWQEFAIFSGCQFTAIAGVLVAAMLLGYRLTQKENDSALVEHVR